MMDGLQNRFQQRSRCFPETKTISLSVVVVLISICITSSLGANKVSSTTISTANIKTSTENKRPLPHIIFILADDLGWNDVGFHGSGQIPTPNIDALAYSGLILNQYYVNPLCTPSRSALMTGKYPIHTGMQHTVLYGGEARGLPLNEKLLPEYLNEFGYSSHIAGKWHLGHYKKIYTPMYRGFKSHVGYWTGHHDYYDHTAVENPSWGLDIRRGFDVAYDLHGKYTTDIITEEAIRVIKNHNVEQTGNGNGTGNGTMAPLFLYVAHGAVHSGNPYNPLPASDSIVSKMNHIDDFNRRKYAAMLTKLDESVGEIVNQLHRSNMLQDSLIVFSTDNGGPAAGFNLNAASNWPLRGVKNTLWEGGVRGAALLWYPQIEQKMRVSKQRMQITDWLPTLLGSFGADLRNSTPIDGINIWDSLSENTKSPRTNILHNIDEIWDMGSLTVGDYKVIKGASPYQGQWDGWYGPSGRDYKYNISVVLNSKSAVAIKKLGLMPNENKIMDLRKEATMSCPTNISEKKCNSIKEPCLYNIKNDPCEIHNLAEELPEILQDLINQLEEINKTSMEPGNKAIDPRADPRYWSNTWTNFGDFIES